MNLLTKVRRYRWFITSRWKIKRQIQSAAKKGNKIKIILGSGGTTYDGWIATDLPHFNIIKRADWEYFFSKNKIDNLLAEHVLEHLTEEEVNIVIYNAYEYLKPGGIFRIAVPDGFNPDPKYIDDVSPTGKTGSYHGHKSLWNYKTFEQLATNKNFSVLINEYYDETGNYFLKDFTDENGFISRTGKIKNAPAKSLVIDLKK